MEWIKAATFKHFNGCKDIITSRGIPGPMKMMYF
jgi:hypothetical protein